MKLSIAAAIAATFSLSVPTLVPPANAETHRINRDYVGSLCVTIPVQNGSNIQI